MYVMGVKHVAGDQVIDKDSGVKLSTKMIKEIGFVTGLSNVSDVTLQITSMKKSLVPVIVGYLTIAAVIYR